MFSNMEGGAPFKEQMEGESSAFGMKLPQLPNLPKPAGPSHKKDWGSISISTMSSNMEGGAIVKKPTEGESNFASSTFGLKMPQLTNMPKPAGPSHKKDWGSISTTTMSPNMEGGALVKKPNGELNSASPAFGLKMPQLPNLPKPAGPSLQRDWGSISTTKASSNMEGCSLVKKPTEGESSSASSTFGLKMPQPTNMPDPAGPSPRKDWGSISNQMAIRKKPNKFAQYIKGRIQLKKEQKMLKQEKKQLKVEKKLAKKEKKKMKSIKKGQKKQRKLQSALKAVKCHDAVVLNALSNSRLGEHDFKSLAKVSYRPFIIRDQWAMLERELKLLDTESLAPLLKMPLITLEELKNHLIEKFGFDRNLSVHVTKATVDQLQEKIGGFISEVERTRILAINLSGCGPEQSHGKNAQMEVDQAPFQLTLVAFNGQGLTFSDSSLIPEQLKSFLSDVAYAKIGSQPDLECQQLKKIGIRLRGWIHCGAIYRALLRNEAKFGIQTQAKFLESEGFVIKAPDHASLEAGIRIIPMNAWVPMAITLASALNFAIKRGYPSDKQMFPVIWEAIDLTRNRVPEDLTLLSSNPLQNWMVGTISQKLNEEHRRVNSARAVLQHRMMSADFVEIFDPSFNPGEAALTPSGIYIDPATKSLDLPGPSELWKDRPTMIKDNCRNCGKLDHKMETCPELGGNVVNCIYPHDGLYLPAHSTRMCPYLHSFCSGCMTAGHREQVHAKPEFTLRELRERYFRHAHLGLITSIPYLVLIPEAASKTQFLSAHWRAGYQGLLFYSDPITRYQLGIGAEECLAITEQFFKDGGQRDRAQLAAVKLALVRRNAEAEHLGDIVPVPKEMPLLAHSFKST